MSLRIDTTEWIAGSLLIGNTGGGELAENIPATGANGPGYAYNDLAFPADTGKEICGRITTWPTLGTLVAFEDTSFTYSGATDSFAYQLYADMVAVGSPVTVSLAVGTTAANASSTQQIAAVTQAATATTLAQAAAAQTLAPITQVATATAPQAGVANASAVQQMAAVTQAATATATATATASASAAQTLSAAAQAATAIAIAQASAAQTLGAVTQTATVINGELLAAPVGHIVAVIDTTAITFGVTQ